MPSTSRTRAAAALAAASLVGLLVLPGVALADPTSPDDPTADPTADPTSPDDPTADPTDDPTDDPTAHPADVAPAPGDAAAAQAHEVVEQRNGATPGGNAEVEDGPGDAPTDGTGDDDAGDEAGDDQGGGGTDSGEDAGDDVGATPRTPRTVLPSPTIGELPPATCTPHLVTVTREHADGDATAVAITSQALEAGVDGWLQVSWEAATGTELTAIELVRTDGSLATLEATPTGTVSDVLALSFCGTASPDDANVGTSLPRIGDDTDGAGEATDGTADGDAATDDDPADAATADGDAATDDDPAEAATADEATAGTADGDVAVTAPRSELPAATVTTASARAPAAAPATPDADEAEVEVLGVQIVAPPPASTDESDDATGAATGDTTTDGPTRLLATPRLADSDGNPGGLHPLLLAAAVAAGLIAGVTVLRGPSRGIATARATSSTGASGDTDATAPTTPGGSA